MANTEKMTQRDYFNEIIALAKANDRSDIVEFAEGRIDILDRKKSSAKTKTNEGNEVIKSAILEVLADNKMTVTEILAKLIANGDVSADTSSQKISAMLKQLKENDGKVDKAKDGKKMLFFVVEGE